MAHPEGRVMTGLDQQLQVQAVALAQRASAEMFQNPFWQDRFGARGRELAEEHGLFDLSHLVQALVASDPSVLMNHARALQTSLVGRGMCSRHISDSFERLERAIAQLVPDSAPAGALLAAARQALTYDSGPARELQLLSDALGELALDALESRQPGWFSAASSYASMALFESIVKAERTRWRGELLELLSYLADALRADRPELFSGHVLWARGFFMRRQGPTGRMEETLYALAECLPAAPELPSPLPEDAAAADGLAPRAERHASRRPPPPRPSLSEPPAPPVLLPMSAELATRARAMLDHALESLAREAADGAARAAKASGT